MFFPLHPGLEIVAHDHMIDQKLQKKVRLCLFEAGYSSDELRIDPEGFLACDWVDAYNGVDRLYRIPANEAFDAADMLDHHLGCVNSLQPCNHISKGG